MMNEMILQELEEMRSFEEMPEEKERFKIRDSNSANWAFRKLRALDTKDKETKGLAKAELRRIKEWEEGELKATEGSRSFFESLLMEYYMTEKEKDDEFKLSTPYGKVTSRKQQLKWSYDDERIIESLKKHGATELVQSQVVEKVDKNNLKSEVEILENVVSLNGEIVQGIVPYEDSNTVFMNVGSGELYDIEDYIYHKEVVTYKGKVIEGVSIEERPDTVTIKVEE